MLGWRGANLNTFYSGSESLHVFNGLVGQIWWTKFLCSPVFKAAIAPVLLAAFCQIYSENYK